MRSKKPPKRNIRAGFLPNFVPNLPPEAVPVRNWCDILRAANPRDPQIAVLELEIRDICDKAAHESFNRELEDASYSCPTKFSSLVRRISGKRIHRPPNQTISFDNKIHTKRYSIAKKFNKQYSSIGNHSHLRITRKVLRRIRKKKLDPEFSLFNDDDAIAAIRRAKSSTAAGPDGMTMVHLKHFGRRAISFLTTLFNLCQEL